MKRRFFLLAAPAIVAAPSLMRISTVTNLFIPPKPKVLYANCLFADSDLVDWKNRPLSLVEELAEIQEEALRKVREMTGIPNYLRAKIVDSEVLRDHNYMGVIWRARVEVS